MKGVAIMHNEELEKLVNEALRESPPAPEALRRNVMASVRKLEHEKTAQTKPKRSVFKYTPLLAGAAAFVLIVVLAGPTVLRGFFSKSADNSMSGGTPQYAMSSSNGSAEDRKTGFSGLDVSTGSAEIDAGGGSAYTEPGDAENSVASGRIILPNDAPPALYTDGVIDDTSGVLNAVGTTYTITGELPEELAEFAGAVDDDGSVIYTDIPDDIIELLLENHPTITAEPSEDSGITIKWLP